MNPIVFSYFILLTSFSFVSSEEDPYDVLGVKKSASQREIQKAYHRLSRLHHPDKNRNDPNANDRFSRINQAYDVLSDPEKRREFDSYGHAGAPRHRGGGFHTADSSFFFHHGHGGGGGGDPFEFMFNFAGGGGGGAGAGDSMRVNRRVVETKLMPESVTRPSLILCKVHMCFQCGPISQLWNRVADELTAHGVTMATAYLDEPGGLAEYLRVSSIPAIIGITNRRIFNYASYESSREISISSLVSFLRKMLPSNLLEPVTDGNLASEFVNNFEDGRARVLLGYSALASGQNARESLKVPPPLRFALAAFRHRLQAKFGHVRIDLLYSKNTQDIFERYNLPRVGETISILNENHEKSGPVYSKFTNPKSIGSHMELSAAAIDSVVMKRAFLVLPRIFSGHMLSLVCPPESEADADSFGELTLCVLLIVDRRSPVPTVVDQFRDFAERFGQEKSKQMGYKVRFCYIYSSVQTGFANALRTSRSGSSSSSSSTAGNLDVAILKQRDHGQVSFDFMSSIWDPEEARISENFVEDKILTYSGNRGRQLPFFARLPELLDENRESLLLRIVWRLQDWFDRISFMVTASDSPMFYVTLMCTLFVGVGSVILHSILSAIRGILTPPSESKPSLSSGKNLRHPQVDHHQMLNVQLFCAETCDQLVKNLPRGELSVVLMTTRDLQGQLLQAFVEAITPFTQYHRLRFAFLDLNMPENTAWYRKLLETSLGRQVNFSWERCAGTVLAINGYRDYYCLYHPAYKSISTVGRFAGLDDDDDGDSLQFRDCFVADPKKMLARLPRWLDCLLEGTLKRFRLEHWPDMAQIVADLQEKDNDAHISS